MEVAPWLPLCPGWFRPWFLFLCGFPFHRIMELSRLEKSFRISKSIHPFLLPLHVLIFTRGFLHDFLSVSQAAFLFLFHPVLVTWKHAKDRLLQNTSTRVSLLGPASRWRAAALAALGGVFFLHLCSAPCPSAGRARPWAAIAPFFPSAPAFVASLPGHILEDVGQVG